jgi:hypothetical protein
VLLGEKVGGLALAGTAITLAGVSVGTYLASAAPSD